RGGRPSAATLDGPARRPLQDRKGARWKPSDYPCGRFARSCGRSGPWVGPTARWRRGLRVGLGTVSTVERRARAAGLDWGHVDTLSDEALEARVYGPPTPPTHHRTVPDCAYLHAERRKPGVTLELLHLEYLEVLLSGYCYTQ